MQVGVNLINFGPAADPLTLERWVNVVEGLGFHSLLTSDHVATTADVHSRYPAPFYEPLTTLGWLAARTSRLKIGTTVVVVPYRNPLGVARAFANVDQLSGGRLIVGVGVGWATQEFEVLGVPFNRRGAITDEYLAAMKTLWTNDVASFEGKTISFENVVTAPRPVQTPHPPIWVGGASDAALRRAVRLGDAWHPVRPMAPAFARDDIPRLRRIAAAENRPIPALCPRLRFEVRPEPVDDDARYIGQGSIDQIHRDLAELEALGCEHVILDTYHDDVEAVSRVHDGWAMLAQMAERVLDLDNETVRFSQGRDEGRAANLNDVDIERLGEDLPLLEGIRTTRSIRRLRPDPVPPALIRKVCEAGTFAPSGGNRQPWLFIAVTEAERRAWIAERYRREFEAYIAPALEAARCPDYPEVKRRNMKAAIHLAEHFADVPVHLFVAGWTRRGAEQSQALFPCVQNILLACRAVGLGASLTRIHTRFRDELDPWLGLGPDTPTAALLPIGWPAGRYGRPPRRPVDDSLHFERYAGPSPRAR